MDELVCEICGKPEERTDEYERVLFDADDSAPQWGRWVAEAAANGNEPTIHIEIDRWSSIVWHTLVLCDEHLVS